MYVNLQLRGVIESNQKPAQSTIHVPLIEFALFSRMNK